MYVVRLACSLIGIPSRLQGKTPPAGRKFRSNVPKSSKNRTIAPMLQKCLDTPGVHLIDVPIDYADNDRILNREIKELSAKV